MIEESEQLITKRLAFRIVVRLSRQSQTLRDGTSDRAPFKAVRTTTRSTISSQELVSKKFAAQTQS